MGTLEIILITAVVEAVAALGVTGIITIMRRRIKVTGPATEAIDWIKAELIRQSKTVGCLFTIQRPQLEALAALLEASRGTVNGNVELATVAVQKAKKKFDDFVNQTVGGECKEGGIE